MNRWPKLAAACEAAARLLAAPSGYMPVLALALTAAVKIRALAGIEGVGLFRSLPAVVAGDVVVYLGVAAALAVFEARAGTLRALTIPLAALVLAHAAVNAALLAVAGEQLSSEAIALGLERFGDLRGIVAEQFRRTGWVAPGVALLALGGLPFLIRRLLPPLPDAGAVGRAAVGRACVSGFAAGITALVWLVLPPPTSDALRRLADSGLVRSMPGPWTSDAPGKSSDYGGAETPARDDAEIVELVRRGPRPDILLLVLESTRYDHSTLPDNESTAQAHTPNLLRLARQGAWARRARAVVPHTTKSLYAMLCGRLPQIRRPLIELTEGAGGGCLPELLSRAGYRTAFFQSAIGAFEERPRLVHNLGFDHFEAWEEIGGEPLGYLASDDESLAVPFGEWESSTRDGRPFFATLLTSAAHHSYRLSRRILDRIGEASGMGERERYARILEAQDVLLGALLDGLGDDTLVIVVGDHGEGFAAKGVRQHDNNFYEEGLHVPLVLAGPGVPSGPVEPNVSLVDLAPTVLDLLVAGPPQVPADPRLGASVFAPRAEDRPSYFACLYDGYCYGYVVGDEKVVDRPRDGEVWRFDLARDPDERSPREILAGADPRLDARLDDLRRLVRATRAPGEVFELGGIRPYGEWSCPPDEPCRHPATPETGLFGPVR